MNCKQCTTTQVLRNLPKSPPLFSFSFFFLAGAPAVGLGFDGVTCCNVDLVEPELADMGACFLGGLTALPDVLFETLRLQEKEVGGSVFDLLTVDAFEIVLFAAGFVFFGVTVVVFWTGNAGVEDFLTEAFDDVDDFLVVVVVAGVDDVAFFTVLVVECESGTACFFLIGSAVDLFLFGTAFVHVCAFLGDDVPAEVVGLLVFLVPCFPSFSS